MNRLIAKLVGRSAKTWQAHLKTVDESVGQMQTAGSLAINFGAEIIAASAAFIATPSADTCRAWIELESLRTAACAVANELRDLSGMRRNELLGTPESKAKLRDAYAEVKAGLLQRQKEIVAADQRREEETGIAESSVATLAAIAHQIDLLDTGLAWVDQDTPRAVASLQSVIG